MSVKCEFCEGTGKEPDLDGCVWCHSTGMKVGQTLATAPKSPQAAQPVGMLLIDEYFDNREVGEVDVTLNGEACERLARDYPGQTLPLYTHVDAGEVEALKLNLKYAEEGSASFAAEADALQKQVDTLRAQLAERDAELEELATEMTLAITDSQIRSAMTVIGRSRFLKLLQSYNARIDAALSTTAKSEAVADGKARDV
jgi:hypothetical protein